VFQTAFACLKVTCSLFVKSYGISFQMKTKWLGNMNYFQGVCVLWGTNMVTLLLRYWRRKFNALPLWFHCANLYPKKIECSQIGDWIYHAPCLLIQLLVSISILNRLKGIYLSFKWNTCTSRCWIRLCLTFFVCGPVQFVQLYHLIKYHVYNICSIQMYIALANVNLANYNMQTPIF
jgi:hypothetical protein